MDLKSPDEQGSLTTSRYRPDDGRTVVVSTDAALSGPLADRFAIGCSVEVEGRGEVAACAADIPCPPWWTTACAERCAALEGLLYARTLTTGPVVLRTDDRSLLAVLSGEGRHREAPPTSPPGFAVSELVRAIREVSADFDSFRAEWVPRGLNRRADALAAFGSGSRMRPERDHRVVPVRDAWARRQGEPQPLLLRLDWF